MNSRETLTQKLESIKQAQKDARKQFKAALDKMYEEQRKLMKDLRQQREAAWAEYKATKQQKPEAVEQQSETEDEFEPTVSTKETEEAAA